MFCTFATMHLYVDLFIYVLLGAYKVPFILFGKTMYFLNIKKKSIVMWGDRGNN